MTNIIFQITVVVFAVVLSASCYWGPDLPPGPYCGLRNECCVDRRDSCAHRILDTMCYCDEFCNRTASHDDCCPDYFAVCHGVTEPPPAPLVMPCKHRGELYLPGQTVDEDCNTCECVQEGEYGATWKCTKDPCLISQEVIRGVNSEGSTWRAYNYTQFQGKKLKDAMIYYLGTLPLSPQTKRAGAIHYYKDIDYPRSFDARTVWPNYISPISDQGWCGSDWAVSLASVVSDRFAIQSNGAENLLISPQILLSCNRRQQQGCNGGHFDVAWTFAKTFGLVDEDCFPYQAKVTDCPFKKDHNLIQDGCVPKNNKRSSRYKVGPPSRLANEQDIMYDIMDAGPVQALMMVHQDFFHYHDGIYRRSRHGNNAFEGLHSVRILGWGEDRGDKFWIVANSWGRQWGENGYFRIARGENQSGIENFVVTVLVEAVQANHQ